LAGSSQFKVSFPSPDIWFERLYTFLEIVRSESKKILGNPFTKVLGDGVLLFMQEEKTDPKKFIEFAERLSKRIKSVNEKRYAAKAWEIEFKCALDYGSNIYVLHDGDPQGTVIDRAYRISTYLMPNMIGVSNQLRTRLGQSLSGCFVLAGRAYLKGVSEEWQEIFALKTIEGFSCQLSDEQRRKEALKDIWEMGEPDQPIWVVCGAIRDERGRDRSTYTLQHGDSNALIELINTFSKLYPDRRIRIVNSQEYLKQNGPTLDDDIVCVSGPEYNLVSERIIEKLSLPIRFDSDRAKRKHDDSILTYTDRNGRRFRLNTERDKSGRIVRDAMFFGKFKDAVVEGRFIYMIMGNETQGTLAGATLFGISSPYLLENYEYMKISTLKKVANLTGFGILAKATAIEDYVEPIQLSNSHEAKFFPVPSYRIT
jgi:hypothetical protein